MGDQPIDAHGVEQFGRVLDVPGQLIVVEEREREIPLRRLRADLGDLEAKAAQFGAAGGGLHDELNAEQWIAVGVPVRGRRVDDQIERHVLVRQDLDHAPADPRRATPCRRGCRRVGSAPEAH